MNADLRGQTVLVTGGARGIGEAVTRRLAASGARVAIHYNQSEAAARALTDEIPDARAFQADLADISAVRRLFEAVVAELGTLHVLVNNAGVAHRIDALETGDAWERGWDATMDVNLKSAALLSRLAVAHFLESGGGRIVTVSSRAAFRGDAPEYMAYAASKAGLVGFTRSIARGFGKKGVKAFVVAPGFTRTDMAREFIDEYGEDYAVRDIALERMTEPEDVANVVVFLASGLADHATGCTIDVNAGSYVH